MKNATLLLLSLSITTFVFAQKPRKFGAVTKDELSITKYDKDTTAKAVKLYEYGASTVGYNSSGFYVTLTVHEIIKLFDDDEFHRGDISIRYPEGSNVQKLKAMTYNLVDGKMVESELSKSDIFEEHVTKGVKVKKFSMPDLSPGSIIEYSYLVKSGNLFFLNGWYFQSTIPTIWSEYRIAYPEWFKYKKLSQGYLGFAINEQKEANFNISGQTVRGTSQRFVVKEAPAFKTEKYLTSVNNYLSKIDFELAAIQIPPSTNSSGYFEQFFTDFDNIRTTLMKDSNFGGRLDDGKFLKDEITQIKDANNSSTEQLAAIYSFIKDHVNWNNTYSKYGHLSVKKVFEGNKANSADINLLLVAVLREAGFTANPVIISTRENGLVHPIFPLIKKYNHVICQVINGEKKYLLDATDKLVPFGLLPKADLNGQGRLISETKTSWVKLIPGGGLNTITKADFNIEEGGELKGSIASTFDEYAGISLRHKIDKQGLANYKKTISETDEWQVDNIVVENVDKVDMPIEEEIETMLEEGVEDLGDIIYLSPILVDRIDANPFKLEKRQYPVDYSYPIRKQSDITVNFPKGFKIEEKPQNFEEFLPNKGGHYTYNIETGNNWIRIRSEFEITKVTFLPKEYVKLKSFYNDIIAKQAEQVVLKKSVE